VKLVFAVNVSADNPEGILKPGMPADVFIDSAAAPVETSK
jgi:HlyD family secretion protein